MNKLNCDALRNIPVSEELINKALDIPHDPDIVKKHTRFNFRFIAAAASIVIALLISVSLMIYSSVRAPETVQPDGAPGESEMLRSFINGFFTCSNSPSDIMAFVNRYVSTEKNTTYPETKTKSESVPDVTASTLSPSQNPTVNTEPTVTRAINPVRSETTRPTEPKFAQPVRTDNDEPEHMDIPQPTQIETSAPVITPTKPTAEPETDPPYEPWLEPDAPAYYCDGYYYRWQFPTSVKFYCRIFDSDGNILGDSDPYSEQHRAVMRVLPDNPDTAYLTYIHGLYDILPAPGKYRFEFYVDMHGLTVSSGRRYLKTGILSKELPPVPESSPSPQKPIEYLDSCYYFSYSSGQYYCKILDMDGNLLGDENLYSDQHKVDCYKENGNNVYTLRYTPKDHGILPSSGRYYFEFYQAYGNRDGYIYGYTQYFND